MARSSSRVRLAEVDPRGQRLPALVEVDVLAGEVVGKLLDRRGEEDAEPGQIERCLGDVVPVLAGQQGVLERLDERVLGIA
jgi:hypothetical protein